MKLPRKASVTALLLAASTYAGLAQQSPDGVGARDDAYVSTYHPRVKLSDPNQQIKDDPPGRRESFREQMGGDSVPNSWRP